MSKKFQFTLTCEVTLTEEHLWPDGNGPECPTLEDVVDLIRENGGREAFIDDVITDLDDELITEPVLLVSDPEAGRGQRVE